MIFLIHQIVGVIANPIGLVFLLLVVGMLLALIGRRRSACWILSADIALVIVMSSPLVNGWLTSWLESPYPPVRVETLPEADAVVVLGGGISGIPEGSISPYPGLHEGADRVWHGARIWHAKSSVTGSNAVMKIYCTCPDVSTSTPPFLKDLGVPDNCIIPFDGPRNTEEEARRYEVEIPGKRVYLVTSALHMRRALMIFRKFAPHIVTIPAATDHIIIDNPNSKMTWRTFLPDWSSFVNFSAVLHELLGLVRYAF